MEQSKKTIFQISLALTKNKKVLQKVNIKQARMQTEINPAKTTTKKNPIRIKSLF